MAGVIGIYGLIVGVILGQSITKPSLARDNTYSVYTGMAHVSPYLHSLSRTVVVVVVVVTLSLTHKHFSLSLSLSPSHTHNHISHSSLRVSAVVSVVW